MRSVPPVQSVWLEESKDRPPVDLDKMTAPSLRTSLHGNSEQRYKNDSKCWPTKKLDLLRQDFAVQERQRHCDSHHLKYVVGDAIPLVVCVQNPEEFLLARGLEVQALMFVALLGLKLISYYGK